MSRLAPDRTAVVVAGATATGKTAVGEALAAELDGVVVCADARQIFADLDIGTGKPSAAERGARPHALFDWCVLGEPVNAGAWARAAAASCEAAFAAGRVPVLVGGSGLYLRALLEGLHGESGHDPEVRAELEAEVAREGLEMLRARLAAIDPVTAARLAPNDRQRIVRALEVAIATGRPLSARHMEPRQPVLRASFCVIEMTASPTPLAARIATRTRALFGGGLLEETEALVAAGKRGSLAALHAIGYDESLAHLDGACTLAQAIAATELRTRQLAKRQRTWFRHQLKAERLDTDGIAESDLAPAAMRLLRALEPGV